MSRRHPNSRPSSCTLIALSVLLGVTGTTQAQDAPPNSGTVDPESAPKAPGPKASDAGDKSAALADAKEQFALGKKAHNAGDYEAAAEHYLESYKLAAHPLLLFNLGQVYRLRGDNARALEYYRSYLTFDPEGAGAPIARDVIAELEGDEVNATPTSEATSKEATSKEGSTASEAGSGDDEERALGQPSSSESIEVDFESSEPSSGRSELGLQSPGPHTPDEGSKGLRVASYAAFGIGTLGILAGVYYGLEARSVSNELSSYEGVWTPKVQGRYESGERAERRAMLGFLLGGASVVAGGVLLYLARPADGEEIRLTISTSAEGGVVGVSGRF